MKKKITSKDVAKLSGVSQSTVSFVLNNVEGIGISETTKAKVIAVAKKIGYGPYAHSSEIAKNNTIAILIPNLFNPYYSMLASHIERCAFQNGYCTVICETQKEVRQETEYFKLLEKNSVLGAIFGYSPDITNQFTAFSQNVPIVVLGEMSPDANLDVVGLNSTKAGYLMAKHLLDLGHEKIAFLALDFKHPDRLEGIKQAMKEHGREDKLTVLVGEDFQDGKASKTVIEIGRNMTAHVVAHHDVTAIIAVNDILASGVYSCLVKEGIRIPDDMSICGFDNSIIAEFLYPSLTTIDHCLQLRSKLVIDILKERLDKTANQSSASQKYSVIYDPLLIVRDSTAVVK